MRSKSTPAHAVEHDDSSTTPVCRGWMISTTMWMRGVDEEQMRVVRVDKGGERPGSLSHYLTPWPAVTQKPVNGKYVLFARACDNEP